MKSYAAPVEVGRTDGRAAGVARVVESKNPKFNVGDVVEIYMGWQEHAISDGKGLRKLDQALAPVSTALGVLGMPGLTAYFRIAGRVRSEGWRDRSVVSGAAAQSDPLWARSRRSRAAAWLESPARTTRSKWIKRECGFDAGFNYKTTEDYGAALKELCPKGVDVYFDNVGGAITDAVMFQLNTHCARFRSAGRFRSTTTRSRRWDRDYWEC
jgi:NADPH-dependent curcumin reductase CurA